MTLRSLSGICALLLLAACGRSDAPSNAGVPSDSPTATRWELAQPPVATEYETMGHAVAIQGDVAVVGGWDAANLKQTVFVYRRAGDGWRFEQRLPLAEQEISGFVPGRGRIQIDDGLIVVETFSAVFVYRHDGRTWAPDLVVTRAQLGRGQFEAVAVQGDVFAFTFNAAAENQHHRESRVHIYRHVTGKWVKEAECVPADGLNRGFEQFGSVLAIDGGMLVAASGFHSVGDKAGGAAYLFRNGSNGWKEEAHLTAPDAGDDIQLGSTVAASPTRVLLGAPGYRDASGNHGAVFEFLNRNGRWEQGAVIVHPGANENRFGDVLAMAGDTMVAGSPFAFEDWRGAAYVFRLRDGAWAATDLAEETPGPQQGFGFDVATDGRRAIVSSWGQTAMRIGGLVPILDAPDEPPEPPPVIRRGAAIYDLERAWK